MNPAVALTLADGFGEDDGARLYRAYAIGFAKAAIRRALALNDYAALPAALIVLEEAA
jgi:hypothetical protein